MTLSDISNTAVSVHEDSRLGTDFSVAKENNVNVPDKSGLVDESNLDVVVTVDSPFRRSTLSPSRSPRRPSQQPPRKEEKDAGLSQLAGEVRARACQLTAKLCAERVRAIQASRDGTDTGAPAALAQPLSGDKDPSALAELSCLLRVSAGATREVTKLLKKQAKKCDNEDTGVAALEVLKSLVRSCGKRLVLHIATREFTSGLCKVAMGSQFEGIRQCVVTMFDDWQSDFGDDSRMAMFGKACRALAAKGIVAGVKPSTTTSQVDMAKEIEELKASLRKAHELELRWKGKFEEEQKNKKALFHELLALSANSKEASKGPPNALHHEQTRALEDEISRLRNKCKALEEEALVRSPPKSNAFEETESHLVNSEEIEKLKDQNEAMTLANVKLKSKLSQSVTELKELSTELVELKSEFSAQVRDVQKESEAMVLNGLTAMISNWTEAKKPKDPLFAQKLIETSQSIKEIKIELGTLRQQASHLTVGSVKGCLSAFMKDVNELVEKMAADRKKTVDSMTNKYNKQKRITEEVKSQNERDLKKALQKHKYQFFAERKKAFQVVVAKIRAFKQSVDMVRSNVVDFKNSFLPTTLNLLGDSLAPHISMNQGKRRGHDATSFAMKLCSTVGENFLEKYRRMSQERIKLYNQLLEMKGNIRVFCRVRPFTKEELEEEPAVSMIDDNEIVLYNAPLAMEKSFTFSQVYGPGVGQVSVFEDLKPVIHSVTDGYNACVFAYGQTGSGKTYTMDGPADNAGLTQRSIRHIFEIVSEKGCDFDYDIRLSSLEIYNDEIRDLLGPDDSSLEIRMGQKGLPYVKDLYEVKLQTLDNAFYWMNRARQNRVMAATKSNDHSSRSHWLLTLVVSGRDKATGDSFTGKLTLADLAGSERLTNLQNDVTRERMKEMQHINRSLSALGDVISSLAGKKAHVPYRNSKLTHLLQDSLGGDAKVFMFVNITPCQSNISETLCSLNFATRAGKVELVPNNAKPSGGKETANLKRELTHYKGLCSKMEAALAVHAKLSKSQRGATKTPNTKQGTK